MSNPPISYFLRQASGCERGSMNPRNEICGKITVKHIYEIAKIKSQDELYECVDMKQIFQEVLNRAWTMGLKVVHRLDEKDYAEFLEERKKIVQQQLLELEEAENDARLLSQRLQKQSENFVNQIECLQMSLVKANQVIEDNKNKIKSLQESEIKLKTELMMSLISKSERGSSDKKEDIMIKIEKTEPFYSFDQLHSRGHYSTYYADSKQSFNDLEMFISEDSLTPSFGSSFHVQNINYQMPFRKRQNKSATPLCETAKPRKIEVLFGTKPDVSNPD